MPQCTTRQKFAGVDGVSIKLDIDGVTESPPVWVSSDETVFLPVVEADGLSGTINSVAPSHLDADGLPVPVRVVVTADADPGPDEVVLTKVFEDLICTLDPRDVPLATRINAELGAPVDK